MRLKTKEWHQSEDIGFFRNIFFQNIVRNSYVDRSKKHTQLRLLNGGFYIKISNIID